MFLISIANLFSSQINYEKLKKKQNKQYIYIINIKKDKGKTTNLANVASEGMTKAAIIDTPNTASIVVTRS